MASPLLKIDGEDSYQWISTKFKRIKTISTRHRCHFFICVSFSTINEFVAPPTAAALLRMRTNSDVRTGSRRPNFLLLERFTNFFLICRVTTISFDLSRYKNLLSFWTYTVYAVNNVYLLRYLDSFKFRMGTSPASIARLWWRQNN